MDDVPETLQQLVGRRLLEMGSARGRNEPLSLLEAFRAVDSPEVTYELVRRVEKGAHTNIGDPAVRTIATMLDVSENEVRAAAGQRPALGPFRLPPRANKLQKTEREVVLAVVDAILSAGDRAEQERVQKRRRLAAAPDPHDEHWEEAAYAPGEPPGPHDEERT